MAISQWEDELKTGVEQFDNEHAVLFRLIDDLNNAMRARQGDVVIDGILESLETYAKTHFRHEEEFMEKIEYPKLQEQISEHQKFTNDIAGFRFDMLQNHLDITIRVGNYLREWLRAHIKIKDKDYGSFAREKGLI